MSPPLAIRLTELDDDGHALPNVLLLHSDQQPRLVGRLVVLPAHADPLTGRLVPTRADGSEPVADDTADELPDDDTVTEWFDPTAADGQPVVATRAPLSTDVRYGELVMRLDLDTVRWLLDVHDRFGQVRVDVWQNLPGGLGEALDPPTWQHVRVFQLDVHDMFVTIAGRAVARGGPLPDIDEGVVGTTTMDDYTARHWTTTPPPSTP